MSFNINIKGVNFKKNGVLASGILGVTGWSMVKVAQSGAGAVTSKSISKDIREGHKSPVMQLFSAGLINAVGLSSTGITNSNNELKVVRENSDSVIIASVFADSPENFAETVSLLDNRYFDIVELNISCPNVQSEFGTPFSSSPKDAGLVTKLVRKITNKPIAVKLSPNFGNIVEVAKSVESEGADIITAINSVGPGMLIDINSFRPKLTNKTGGVTGPAILPIAIRAVYDIYKNVKIPIIGVGGIRNFEDALQIIMAGATLYSVGTGILYEGLEVFNKINSDIENFLNEKKLTYNEIIGASHKL